MRRASSVRAISLWFVRGMAHHPSHEPGDEGNIRDIGAVRERDIGCAACDALYPCLNSLLCERDAYGILSVSRAGNEESTRHRSSS